MLEMWADLGKLTSLQVLGCDEGTLAAYYGIERFGIHLDDLADMDDTVKVQVWCQRRISENSPLNPCMHVGMPAA